MAEEADVKLIGRSVSPFVVRAMIALNLKGIAYEFLQEEFGKKSELLLQSNPVYKLIPVLIHGGKPICESLIIVQYVDEAWPASGPPILPTDPYERALARFWAAYVDDKLTPPARVLIRGGDEESKKLAKEQLFAALLQLEEAHVKSSEGKSFFSGDTIGFVDIALGSYIAWLKAMEEIEDVKFLDEEKTPHLVEWAESFCSATVSKGVFPEIEELVAICQVLRSARGAAPPPSN